MPQMFPAPIFLLMVSIGALFMLYMIRLYWCDIVSSKPFASKDESSSSSLSFNSYW